MTYTIEEIIEAMKKICLRRGRIKNNVLGMAHFTICTVIAISYGIGYSVANKKVKTNYFKRR